MSSGEGPDDAFDLQVEEGDGNRRDGLMGEGDEVFE
jgi:hypothetical protein